MYKFKKPYKTSINKNTSYIGERIEEKVHRIVNNKEPIKDGAPLVYSDREDGVLPECDPRTDRMEVALELADKISRSHTAHREDRIGQRAMQNMTEEQKAEYVKNHPNVKYTPPNKETGSQPTPGTSPGGTN